MFLVVYEHVFDHDQLGLPAAQIKSTQDIQFHPLDIYRDKVNFPHNGMFQHPIKRSYRHPDCFTRERGAYLRFNGRMSIGQTKVEISISCVGGRTQCHFKNLAVRALFPQLLAEVRVGFDQNAPPSVLFQKPGLAAISRVVGSNFNKKALLPPHEVPQKRARFRDGLRFLCDQRMWSGPFM